MSDNQERDFNPFEVDRDQPLQPVSLAPVFSSEHTQRNELSLSSVPAGTPGAALVFQAPTIVPLPARIDEDEDEDEAQANEEPPRRRRNRTATSGEPPSRRRSHSRQLLAAEEEIDADYSSSEEEALANPAEGEAELLETARRRRRRRARSEEDTPEVSDEVTSVKGSTRLEAKRQRRRETRRDNRRRTAVTESEFLARRESVKREMVVREKDGLNQIAVLEDGLLVEHYVARRTQQTMVGNIYLGRVQNVLPSMEAAFVDLGKGRNAVLYAGEVNWDAAGMAGRPRRIEQALKSGDTVLVQVTKDPIGHKGARLTAQITLAGRYLVLVPGGQMTGISRKLPDKERSRLKKLLGAIVPKDFGVIVRTAAEGASETQLRADVERLQGQWEQIEKKQKGGQKAPALLRAEPELAVRVVRDVFNEDFTSLIVQGKGAWETINEYVRELSPDLVDRLQHWVKKDDVFSAHRIDEQLTKGMDRKVWLPSGGSLIIDRTEAMTVIDVNTGKFIGSGGTLEETVTKNNLEAAEEIVRQLRLRDIGGIVVIDFVDMVLEANRDLVLRRLVECLGRDRTRHQVTEITSLGLVQMTRKRVGEGLVEAFSTPCECCEGRGFIVHDDPVERDQGGHRQERVDTPKSGRKADRHLGQSQQVERRREQTRNALSAIAAAAASSHQDEEDEPTPAPVSACKESAPKGKRSKVGKAKSDKTPAPEVAAADVAGEVEQAPASEREAEPAAGVEDSAGAPAGGAATKEMPSEKTITPKQEARSKKDSGDLTVPAQPTAVAEQERPARSARRAGASPDTSAPAVGRRRSGRRAATMSAGKPVSIELPPPLEAAPVIARPAALTVADIELPPARGRGSSRSRRVVMDRPQTEDGSAS